MILLLWASMAWSSDVLIALYPGYLTRIECSGRLLATAVGNEQEFTLEALPKELGCGVLIRPRSKEGRTNLLIETTTGASEVILEIRSPKKPPTSHDLRWSLLQASGGTSP